MTKVLQLLLIVALAVCAAAGQSSGKRNERPTAGGPKKTVDKSFVPTYFYEFDRPGFIYPNVRIEHDKTGSGRIVFRRDGYTEDLEDPIRLSPGTIEKIDAAFAALNFVDSTEDYQTKMDHSNMGNVTIRLMRDGKERTAKYNWSENKDAKFLMDEYRRISNEYTWRFEIISSRANQPLLSPGIMESLDSYIQRGEISDPVQLLPFLGELSADERLPLIARNKASKIIKNIEKAAKK